MEDRNNFRKEEFILTQEVNRPSQWESLVAGDSITSEAGKQRQMLELRSLPLAIQSRTPAHGRVPTTLRVDRLASLETPLWTRPEAHHLGDSRACKIAGQ